MDPTITAAIGAGVLDAELAALVWLLTQGRVAVHVAGDGEVAAALVDAVRDITSDPALVTAGPGARLEDVIRQPVPLRPSIGVVLVVTDGRVRAAHLLRAPLRDAGGHVHPQGPAVLATWDERDAIWEHFGWALAPEIAETIGRPAGDVEIEQGRRRAYLDALVAAGVEAPREVRAAIAGYGLPARPQ